MATSTVTYNLPNLGGPMLDASVVAANPTATTLLANCEGSHNDYNCIFNASMTFGPWALPTPPPDASTGVYDLYIVNPPFTGSNEPATISTAVGENDKITWTYSIHCEMTDYTVPSVCTTINHGGADGGKETATVTGTDISSLAIPITAVPFAVTAGYSKLAAATSTASGAVSSGMTSAAAAATGKNGTHTATLTPSGSGSRSSSATGVSASSNAASIVYGSIGNLGLLALVAAYLVR